MDSLTGATPCRMPRRRMPDLAFFTILFLLVAGAPILIVSAHLLPWGQTSNNKLYAPYELFGLSASLGVMLIALRDWLRRRGEGWRAVLPVVVPLMVGLHYAGYIAEHTSKMYDYLCYEQAVNNLYASGNPYADPVYHFLYPPAFAQVFGMIYAWTQSLAINQAVMGNFAFYLYQCAQFFMILLLLRLLSEFGRRLGIGPGSALILAALLMWVNNPLVRTLRHNQVNLFVLNGLLLGVLLASRRPALAGLALAVAIHIKLFPVLLLGALGLGRRWRAVGYTLLFGALIVLAAPWLPGGARVYSLFLSSLRQMPEFGVFRDNSLHNIVHSVAVVWSGREMLPGRAIPMGGVEKGVALLLQGCAWAWIAWRLGRRQLAWGAARIPCQGECGCEDVLLLGQAAELLALSLLVAPLTWEHHYLFALPLVLWAIGVSGRTRPVRVILGLVLCLGIPTFDLFPFSFHRIAGLIMLLVSTPPAAFPSFKGWTELEATHADS